MKVFVRRHQRPDLYFYLPIFHANGSIRPSCDVWIVGRNDCCAAYLTTKRNDVVHRLVTIVCVKIPGGLIGQD